MKTMKYKISKIPKKKNNDLKDLFTNFSQKYENNRKEIIDKLDQIDSKQNKNSLIEVPRKFK